MAGEIRKNWWCRAHKDIPMQIDVFTAVLQTIHLWTVQRCWLSLPEETSYEGRICATTVLLITILFLHAVQDPANNVDSGIIHLFVKEEFQLSPSKIVFLHQQKRTWALQLGLLQPYMPQCEQWSMDRKQGSWLTQEREVLTSAQTWLQSWKSHRSWPTMAFCLSYVWQCFFCKCFLATAFFLCYAWCNSSWICFMTMAIILSCDWWCLPQFCSIIVTFTLV